jgi:hypothetical protein
LEAPLSNKKLLIFDLFSGTGSATQAFRDAGHTVISFENDSFFEATELIDVFELTAKRLLVEYGRPDFIWASPPCTAFSVASMGHHWINGGANPMPRTEAAAKAQDLVLHTLRLINDLNPPLGWLMENPRGMLRKLPVVAGIPRISITYCQYGDSRMKPTDLWGFVHSDWKSREMCKNGDSCHVAAPRGSQTGTQGLKGARERSRVPIALSQDLLRSFN